MNRASLLLPLPSLAASNDGVKIPSGRPQATFLFPALTSCTVTVEVSPNGTDWYAIPAKDINGDAMTSFTGGTLTVYHGYAHKGYIRASTNQSANNSAESYVIVYS